MNVHEAVISLINQELDSREQFWQRRLDYAFDAGFRCAGKHHFACHKIRQMRKQLDVPLHIAKQYLDSIDYDNTECPICMDKLESRDNTVLSNCGHLFCTNCYSELESRKLVSCPVCANPNMILDKSLWYEEMQKYINRDGGTYEDVGYDEYGFESSDNEDAVGDAVGDAVRDEIRADVIDEIRAVANESNA